MSPILHQKSNGYIRRTLVPSGWTVLRVALTGAVWLATFAWFAPGCGELPDREVADAVPEDELDSGAWTEEPVTHASAKEIQAGDADGESYLVTFRSGDGDAGLYFNNFHEESVHHYAGLADTYLADSRVGDVRYIAAVDLSLRSDPLWRAEFAMPPALRFALGQKSEDEPIVGAVTRVKFRNAADAKDVLNEWQQAGRIWFAEPNRYSRLSQATDLFGKLSEQYAQASQYAHISMIKASDAFKVLSGRDQASTVTDQQVREEPPVIAVLDSGVDYEHPGLKANMWTNDQPGASGCKDDTHGCNTATARKGALGDGDVHPVGADGAGQACTLEKCFHGTHVAGIIAGDPSAGFAGVCPVCQVMAVRVVDLVKGEVRVPDEAQIAGMKYIMYFSRNGSNVVRIVNSSFGKYSRSRTVALIVSVLRRTGKGTLVVAAAGNEDSMSRSYPAALSDALAVAAVDGFGQKTVFSNFGSWVDIAAPGADITSATPGNGSEPKSGTSMAAPMVAGAAGVVLAANPGLSVGQLRDAIVKSADYKIYAADLPGSSGEPGFNYRNYYIRVPGESAPRPLLGSGLLNLADAVQFKTTNTFVSPPMDRVTANCAMVNDPSRRHQDIQRDSYLSAIQIMLTFLALAAPLGHWLFRIVGARTQNSRAASTRERLLL